MGFITKLTYKQMKAGLDMTNVTVPSDKEVIKVDDEANLTMVAWGDPQVSSISPLRSARLKSACLDVANAEGTFDVLAMLGDITEYGRQCEYDAVLDILSECEGKFNKVLCVTGNHDVRLRKHSKQVVKFNSFVRKIKGGIASPGAQYWFSTEIKGYKFICMGTDFGTLEGEYLSRRQLDWLSKELDSAPQDKPVFLLNHQTLPLTNGLPMVWQAYGNWRGTVGWQSEKLANILSAHNNVIFITGHLHLGACKYTYEDCGGFKCLSLPTVGVINHGENSKNSQGYVISVYDDRIVARARYFGEGKWQGGEIPNSVIEIKLK